MSDRAAYDALDAINWSRLKLLDKSPAHFKAGYSGEESKSLRLGTAAHSAVLEPEKFASDFIIYTKRRQGKEWEAFENQATLDKKSVLSQSEYDQACAIRDAVSRNRKASEYLQGGAAEQALVWDIGPFKCKGRADYIGDCIVDLKSTQDSSPKSFARSCAKFGYYGQAAWYSDGHYRATGKRKPFVFVAVESSAPYIVTVFTVPDPVLEFGRDQYLTLLGKLDYCRQRNWWGGYTESEELDLSLPEWSVSNE
jgi:exodeoxyribonuclease VIII